MNIRAILWLAFRELSGRPGRSLLSLLALSLSAGLIAATGSIGALMRSGVTSPAPPAGQPADLWIASAYDVDYDLPASLARQVASVPGVGSVLPLVRRPVRVGTPDSASGVDKAAGVGTDAAGARPDTLTLVGADLGAYFGLHDLQLAAGSLPEAEEPGLVALAPWALGREVEPGQAVTLTLPSGRAVLPVRGLLEVESLASLQQGLVLYAPREVISDLFGLDDATTLLEVWLRAGARPGRVQRALEQELGPAYAVSATVQPRAQLWQRLVLGALGFVDGLTLLASAGLVYAIFALSARTRRRHIALLRVTGAHQRDVLAVLMAEAFLLGMVGSLLGLVLGLGLACAGAAFVLEGAAVGLLPPMPAATLGLALMAGMGAALGGGALPALRAARQPPMEALRAVPSVTNLDGGSRGKRWFPRPLSRLLAGRASLALANLSRQPGRAVGMVAALSLVLGMFVANVGIFSLLNEEIAAAVLGVVIGGACTLLFAVVAGPRLGFSGAGLGGWAVWRPLLTASVAGLFAWPLLGMAGAALPAVAVARIPAMQALAEGHGPGAG